MIKTAEKAGFSYPTQRNQIRFYRAPRSHFTGVESCGQIAKCTKTDVLVFHATRTATTSAVFRVMHRQAPSLITGIRIALCRLSKVTI